ncbi:hypothetical protein AVEN_95264-1 [Araneus ventricosus]|uniref:Uncharacterized protein n=1 Tax=Araneus ventricosus TaxID=182803 RepID=A0A4Y2DHY2_ARAVE|nr:hypothetical protein AVEN_95264-1 [Araneus ventricosus]
MPQHLLRCQIYSPTRKLVVNIHSKQTLSTKLTYVNCFLDSLHISLVISLLLISHNMKCNQITPSNNIMTRSHTIADLLSNFCKSPDQEVRQAREEKRDDRVTHPFKYGEGTDVTPAQGIRP